MNFPDAVGYLLSLGHETLTIKLGLRNTQTLLSALGTPQRNFPAVQIAGTNGKGSTAVMLDSVCRAAGIRTGLFTSPHLTSITERIQIDGQPIAEIDFARLTAKVRDTAAELRESGKLDSLPTFFEHVTAIALLAFGEARVDLAILETGLGGRLDSTTAAGADIVAITAIAMDHEQYLGHALEEIAAEKAAIIRPGVTAIVAPQMAEALAVINQRSKAAGVEPTFVAGAVINGTTRDGRCRITFPTAQIKVENVLLGLRGRHQVTNAAVAVALADALRERGFVISTAAIKTGLERAVHPGRLELRTGNPHILLDGAHNPSAARALREYLEEFVKHPINMIFGGMRDKDLEQLARILFPVAKKVILTELDNPRAATGDMLLKAAKTAISDGDILLASSPRDALSRAAEIASPQDLICVTGSLYLIGEVRALLGEQPSLIASQMAAH